MQRIGARCPVSDKIHFLISFLFELQITLKFIFEPPLKITFYLKLVKIDKISHYQ